ncbi:MAG: DsbA family protein [Janthinobacterium lividum]
MTRLRTRIANQSWGMGIGVAGILVALVAVLTTGSANGEASGAAGRIDTRDRAAVETIVREYILAHPEIIPEAINGMQAREVTKLLASNRHEIETPFAGAYAGNPRGDVTLVEFFDYACPFCRAGHADVKKLIASDPGLRVVYRDFPVLSEASGEAAMASLSAAQQGRYTAFHDRMFETPGKVERVRTIAMVRAAGLNEMRTATDLNSPALKAEIKKNLDLGRALGLTGTPTYIVGDKILNGAVGYDALAQAVTAARKTRAG